MSYHSLEDRLVKNFIQKGKFDGEVEKDFYGNAIKPLNSITRKPVEATRSRNCPKSESPKRETPDRRKSSLR